MKRVIFVVIIQIAIFILSAPLKVSRITPFVTTLRKLRNMLTGNEKRKESCRLVGGEKKRVGHRRENDFKQQYNPASTEEPTEYAATSDTWIREDASIAEKLRHRFSLPMRNLYVSNKSGNNLQFTLGSIPELDTPDNLAWLQDKTHCAELFNKYLKKDGTARPADLLVYKDTKQSKWIFFKMDDVVSFIVENAMWRKLETGRIKGDFLNSSKKGHAQYLTYEFRSTHKSHFLGLNGGKGVQFIELLKERIPFLEDDICDKNEESVTENILESR